MREQRYHGSICVNGEIVLEYVLKYSILSPLRVPAPNVQIGVLLCLRSPTAFASGLIILAASDVLLLGAPCCASQWGLWFGKYW